MPAFEGVYAAALTPRRGAAEIDLGALWSLFDFLGERGLDGIVLMGSTGEFVHFSLDERIRMMSLAVKRSRLPVLINVSHSTLEGALQLAQAASRADAAGLLLMPPYFYRYRQSDLLAFFKAFRDEQSGGPPLLLYNIPPFTNPLEPATIAELIDYGYAGVKDSGGSWDEFEQTRRLCVNLDYTFLAGNDRLFAATRAAGAQGVVSGVASALPELLVAMNRAVCSKNTQQTSILSQHLNEFLDRFDRLPVPMAIREAAAARGLDTGPSALRPDAVLSRALAEFREWFNGWLPEVLKTTAG
jgi:dihydrodipicolinate synthase/N-acetylneuraminate lyase